MADLIIYGHPMSQPSRSVEIFCQLAGLKYQFQEINIFAGEHMKRNFRAINPFQEIPVLKHKEFILWESAAIIQYLAENFNIDSSYYPKNPQIRGKVMAYLHWHHENVRRPITQYARKKVIYPMMLGKPEPSPAQLEKLLKKREEVCQTLEWILQTSTFLARTENVTIADIFAFNEIISGSYFGLSIVKYPKLMSWFQKVASVPEVQKVCGSLLSEYQESMKNPKL
jgi:glutathione S-transferase